MENFPKLITAKEFKIEISLDIVKSCLNEILEFLTTNLELTKGPIHIWDNNTSKLDQKIYNDYLVTAKTAVIPKKLFIFLKRLESFFDSTSLPIRIHDVKNNLLMSSTYDTKYDSENGTVYVSAVHRGKNFKFFKNVTVGDSVIVMYKKNDYWEGKSHRVTFVNKQRTYLRYQKSILTQGYLSLNYEVFDGHSFYKGPGETIPWEVTKKWH